jgi:hypothetical protein
VCAGAAYKYEGQSRTDWAKINGADQSWKARKFESLSGLKQYRVADGIIQEGVIAGEAKYVADWSKSIMNPVSPISFAKRWPGLVRRAFVLQVKDYLLKYDKLVIRTTSQEFKNFYEKVLTNPAWKNRIIWEVVPLK